MQKLIQLENALGRAIASYEAWNLAHQHIQSQETFDRLGAAFSARLRLDIAIEAHVKSMDKAVIA